MPAPAESRKSPARKTPPEECKNSTSSTHGRGTDRERCKEGASVAGTGGRSARSGQPENPRKPGIFWRSFETPRYKVNAIHCVFYLIFEMTVEERDFTRMSENGKPTIWAATHRLGQTRRSLMHEKQKVWKREFGFDRIETAAEMDEKRSRTSTSPVPNPFFYRNMVIPSHPHTPDEFTL